MAANRASRTPASLELPEECFEFIRELYPFFLHVLDECHLTGAQFFALSNLKHSPTKLDERPVMLISTMTETLERVGGYGTSRASMIVAELHNKGLLDKMDISPARRAELFPDSLDGTGKNKIVALREEGMKVIETFNGHIQRLFGELLRSSELPKTVMSFGLSHLPRVAKALSKAARAQAEILGRRATGSAEFS